MATEILDPKRPNWTIPPAKPTTPTTPPSLRSTLGALKPAAMPAGDTLAAGAGGAALAAGVNSIRQGLLNTAAPMAPAATAPGQIPVDPTLQAPPAAAGSLLNQSEGGRNFGNAVNAMMGGSGGLVIGGLTRAASAVGRLTQLERAAPKLSMVAAGGKGYVAGDAAFPGVAPERAEPAAPAPSIRRPFSDARDGVYSAPDNSRDLTGKIVRDLTGKIVRDGRNFSGSNIRLGADIVDPQGNLINGGDPSKPKGFGVTSLDTSEGFRQNLLELQRNAAERASAPAPGGAVSLGSSYRDDANARAREMDFKRAVSEMSPRQRAAAMMQQQSLRNQSEISTAQNEVTTRGQDINAGTARYGADISRANNRDAVSATLRGQDMDYAEKLDAKRLDLAAREAQRNAIAEAWKGTTDPQVAAVRLASKGYDPAAALAVAGGKRASLDATNKAVDDIVDASAVTIGKDGLPVVSPGLKAASKAVLTNAAPGVMTASPEEVAGQAPRLRAISNLASGLQEAQGGSLLQSIGWDEPPPAITTLPNLQGASLRERGFGSPFANASSGDYELVQPDGTVMPMKRARLGERELNYLKQQGVTLRN